MIRFLIVILLVLGLFGSVGLSDYDPMAESNLTAICGAEEGDGQAPGDPWGNECDLQIPCKKCYFSGTHCNSCDSTKKYVLCGTPANVLCADGMAIANCGRVIEHQLLQGLENCDTCHGKGKKRDLTCNKNACQTDTV